MSFADDVEAMSLLGPGCIKIAEQDLSIGANDRIVLQAAVGWIAPGMATCVVEDVVAKRERGFLDRLAGNHRAGACEGARIVRRFVGVSVDDGNGVRAGVQHSGGKLTVRGGRA